MNKQKFIDVHTHHDLIDELKVIAIRSMHVGDSFPQNKASFSCGIHPWKVKDGQLEEKMGQLYSQAKQQQIIAIGECGLDKAIDTPLEIQQQIFEKQIEVAEKFSLPLIIHCVKAYSELLAIRKKHPNGCWIFHGFEGNETLAKQLITKNIHLSIGAALYNPKSKINSSIKHIPVSWLFFETDEQNTFTIQEIYEQASKLSGINSEALKAQIFHNFVNCFKKYMR